MPFRKFISFLALGSPSRVHLVMEHFKRLAELNRIDALVALGKEPMESSQAQLDIADDGDEIAFQVLGCLKAVNGAIRRSKASVAVKNDFIKQTQAYKLGVSVMFYAFNQYYHRHYEQ